MRLAPRLAPPTIPHRSGIVRSDGRLPSRGLPPVLRTTRGLLGAHRLGKRPADLADVLARIATAGPATASLRAMLRIATPESDEDSAAFLASAARAGLGFRALFNQPLAISTVNQVFKSGAYWAKVLKYAQVGNLQAIMDEYVLVLNESLGLMGHAPGERAEKIAVAIATAASLRTPSLGFDEIARDGKGAYTLKLRRVRCRYAMRFGDEKSEGVEEVTRSADVRLAFNSPFRPFILATTSIGQEGLDFHQYCGALEPALQSGRTGTARGPGAPLQGSCDPPKSGQAIWALSRSPLRGRADRPLGASVRPRLQGPLGRSE